MSETETSNCYYLLKKMCLNDNLSCSHQRLCSDIDIKECYYKQLQQLKQKLHQIKTKCQEDWEYMTVDKFQAEISQILGE